MSSQCGGRSRERRSSSRGGYSPQAASVSSGLCSGSTGSLADAPEAAGAAAAGATGAGVSGAGVSGAA